MSTTTGGDPEFRPKWENRRKVIFANLLFSAAVILYLTLFGDDTRLAETIVQFAFINAMGTVGSYVFGASYEEGLMAKFRGT